MSIEFVAPDERGVGTADKRRSNQIPGLFYPRQSEFIRGSSSRLPYPRIWVRANAPPGPEIGRFYQAHTVPPTSQTGRPGGYRLLEDAEK